MPITQNHYHNHYIKISKCWALSFTIPEKAALLNWVLIPARFWQSAAKFDLPRWNCLRIVRRLYETCQLFLDTSLGLMFQNFWKKWWSCPRSLVNWLRFSAILLLRSWPLRLVIALQIQSNNSGNVLLHSLRVHRDPVLLRTTDVFNLVSGSCQGVHVSAPPLPLKFAHINLEVVGPVVNCFPRLHLQYWRETTIDPWVWTTLSKGYALQTPAPKDFKDCHYSDWGSSEEISFLLVKGAI